MMRALTIVFMVQLSLISVSLGEHKKWSEDKSWKYTKEKYTDMDDTYSNFFPDHQDEDLNEDDEDEDFLEDHAAWKAYQDYLDSEAAKKYSKDKQDNGDTNEESDNRTNCGIGRICDRCDHFKHILVGENYEKVCCKSCSDHFDVGYFEDGDKTIPHCTCKYDQIKGDCWKGLACSACDKSIVGNINGVPVCCENCEKSGIRYGLGVKYSTCDCLHNGKK